MSNLPATSTDTVSKPLDPDDALFNPADVTILLVDDERNILSSLTRLFRPQRYRIVTAINGQKGLEVLEKQPVDLVISDMRMPQMDGAQFLEQVALRWPDTMRILLTGYSDIEDTVAAVNRGHIYRYLSKPWNDKDIRTDVRLALEQRFLVQERHRLQELTRKQNAELKTLNNHLEEKVAERTKEVRATLAKLVKSHSSLKSSYVDAVKVFTNLIEMRSGHTKGYTRRVAGIAHQVAQQLGMGDTESQDVLFAGLLHELGKISLSKQLWTKPISSLQLEDRDQMMRYPSLGQGALMSLEYLQGAASIIRHHCERIDGSGFPDRMQGDMIPMGAQVLGTVVDYFGLMVGAVEKTRMSAVDAHAYLRRFCGVRYNTQVVDALFAVIGGQGERAEQEPEIRVVPDELTAGMVLTRDLLSQDNLVWLSRGHILSPSLIRRIQNLGRDYELELYVRFQQVS